MESLKRKKIAVPKNFLVAENLISLSGIRSKPTFSPVDEIDGTHLLTVLVDEGARPRSSTWNHRSLSMRKLFMLDSERGSSKSQSAEGVGCNWRLCFNGFKAAMVRAKSSFMFHFSKFVENKTYPFGRVTETSETKSEEKSFSNLKTPDLERPNEGGSQITISNSRFFLAAHAKYSRLSMLRNSCGPTSSSFNSKLRRAHSRNVRLTSTDVTFEAPPAAAQTLKPPV